MSTTFSVTRDDIITAALRGVGAIDKKASPDQEDFDDCSFALNILIKSWVGSGMPLWKVMEIVLPLQVGLSTYSIGPNAHGPGSLSSDKPLRVLEAFLRDQNGIDTPMSILARADYNYLSLKTTNNSTPNSVYYQPLVEAGQLIIYPPPSTASSNMHLAVQVPIQDVVDGADIVDFPSECYKALKWNLMDEVAEDYGCSDNKIARIERKAKMYKDEMESWSVEEASLYLSHDTRAR